MKAQCSMMRSCVPNVSTVLKSASAIYIGFIKTLRKKRSFEKCSSYMFKIDVLYCIESKSDNFDDFKFMWFYFLVSLL